VTDPYDPVPDLAEVLASAISNPVRVNVHADRIAERLGLGEDDSPEAVAQVLREALGLPSNRTCELMTARGGVRCTRPAVTRLTGACLHGHVAERWVCEDDRVPEEPLWCRACYRLPEPEAHECPVTLFPAPGEGGQFQVQEARAVLARWDRERDDPAAVLFYDRERVLADQLRALLAIIDRTFPGQAEAARAAGTEES